MKKILLFCFLCFSFLTYSQLIWEETNTGTSATISIGEFSVWGMTNPTLNGEELPTGSLIGVFFINASGEYICGGADTWPGSDSGMIAIAPWGDDSTTANQDGFADGENFNWFVRVCDGACWDDADGDGLLDDGEVSDGTDYYSESAVMVEANSQGITGTVYTTNALSALESADFLEYTEEELEECTCADGTTTNIVSTFCFIPVGGCSDSEASNYCYVGDLTPIFQAEDCQYEGGVSGCMCELSFNYDATATTDDGSCIIVSGGCSDSLADNYSGDQCLGSSFLAEDCLYAGCTCIDAYNYDSSASIDDGTCWVLEGGCSDSLANNYSGDECSGSNFVSEDCQYAPVDVDLTWDYDITDGNMTVQIGADVVTFNGLVVPVGSLIGAFFINNNGEYTCGGYLEWTGDQLALAVWAAESGYDNGFEAGEEIIWGLSIGGEDFLATSSTMNSESIFSPTFVSNGFGQLLSAVFEGELESGCTDDTAYNYNSEASIDDGSCYSLDFEYPITDGNMTVQVAQSAIQFNSEEPPCGSLLGGFYTNDFGQLVCAGYQTWCDDFSNNQLAVPLFASETGLDNGFESGEEITWILSIYGQPFIAESVTMNPSPPFSTTFVSNGFGQLLVGIFNGEINGILGCTNSNADNYNADATIDDDSCILPGCTDLEACNYDSNALTDDGSCYYESVWYYDEDGDGLGDYEQYTQVNCDPINEEWVDNFDDPCPGDALNDINENGICDGSEVLGCMNVNATNYNFYANIDDGSCIIPGCTDANSLNYSEEATEDDGSCIPIVSGCLDTDAFNYNLEANTDDGSCCYIAGCTDSNAFNYNPVACYNDQTCIDTIFGCTDASSFNYDSGANTDDDSCIPYVFGCLDQLACNYDNTVNTDNGSCVYAEENYDCDGNCLNDTDGDTVCDELEVNGCTDETAFNYDLLATEDDGSCIAVILGCLDASAFNYDENANIDDGSCCYIVGCTDIEAFNYNSDACYDDGLCVEVMLGCIDSSAFNYDENANTDDGSCVSFIFGCMDTLACNYDSSVNTDNGSCTYPEDYYDCDGVCLNDIDNDQVCDENEVGGCTNPAALNYNPAATDDDFCLFPGCLEIGSCNYDPEGFYYELITCEYESCAGCTNPNADNYNVDATIDDGSCIVYGCIDDTACNYNVDATDDDGSCYNNDLGCGCDQPAADSGFDCDGNCINDSDGDLVCDEFEVGGCTDDTACNYNVDATDDDGSCYNNNLGCGCDQPAADTGFDCDGNCINDSDGDLICDEFEVGGCTDSTACNYNSNATDNDGTCEYSEEGYDCDGNELELDSPWGNNDGCDPFNNHTVAFTIGGLTMGDFIGLFYTNDSGDLVFSQATEYMGDTFYFSVCGDDATTEEKDGFDVGESFIWQLWPVGEECAYSLDVEYDQGQPSSGEYEVNGISQVISISGEPLSVSVSVTDVLCNGGFGSAELTINGGISPYNTEDLTDLSAGTYTTTVVDANGCEESVEFTISEPDALVASVSVTDALCNGGSDGSAELTISGGTTPYNTEDLTGLSAGTYTTTVVDANGCETTVEFSISEPDTLVASVSVTDVSCNGGSDGSVELIVSGGTSPYDTEDLSGLSAGIYTTTVVDINGCETSIEFSVSEPDALVASVSVTDVSCNGGSDGSAAIEINGGNGEYDYNIAIESETNQENNYSMYFDESCIDVGPVEELKIYNDLSILFNIKFNDVQLDHWQEIISCSSTGLDSNSDNNAIYHIEMSPNIQSSEFVANAMYYLHEYGNGNNAMVTLEFPFVANQWYEVSLLRNSESKTIEFYIDGNLESSGSYAENPEGGANAHLAFGCQYDQDSFEDGFEGALDNIRIFNNLVSEDIINCPAISDNEDGLMGYWNFEEGPSSVEVIDQVAGNNGDIDNATYNNNTSEFNCFVSELLVVDDIENLSAGDYVLLVTDSNDCETSVDFTVSEPDALVASISITDALCNGGLGLAELTVTGGTSPYETEDLSDLSAGTYTTTVLDANGCETSVEFTVSEPALLEASVVVTEPSCSGDSDGSAIVTVSGGTPPYNTEELSNLSAGTYTTTVIDANSCEISVEFIVLEPDPIEVVVTTEDVSCNGDSDGSVSIEITGGTGEYDYEVQTESSFNLSPNNYSMMFDGDDYITIPADQLPTAERTVSLWFKTDVIGEVFNFGNALLAYGGTANNPSGATSWLMSVGTCGNGNNAFQVQSHWNVNQVLYDYGNENYNSDWHHWSITTSSSGTIFYLDGIQVSQSDVFISNTNVEGKDLIIGGAVDPDGTGFFEDGCAGAWVGQLDDVQIWDYALSDSEIQQYMNCSPSGSESGLVGYWNFEEGPEQSEVLDLTGNANSGIITGATYTNSFTQNCIESELVFVDDLDNLSAGDYLITVVDDAGCYDIVEFSISEPEELTLTLDSNPGEYSNCSSGTASVFVEGGTGPYTYEWSNGELTAELVGLCGGEYTVIVTDANGCVIEETVIVDYLIPDGWEVNETEIVHIIDIPLDVTMLLDQVNLVAGDYVGVFFDNEDGTQSCGGYVMLINESLQLFAYGNDGVNNGFNQGEQFNWRVWSSETESETFGFAVYDDSYEDERYFNSDGLSGLLGTVFASYQVIPLNENPYSDWDMISTYISTDESVESILNPVSEELIIIKDANGLVYWPQWDINTLTNMNTQDAYAVKTWASNEIIVYGDFVQPEDISFNLSGWNYISYPRYFPASVDVALSSVDGNVKLLKDDSGNLYWPELGINTISEMEAGEGYILRVINDQLFNYPSNSNNVESIDGPTTAERFGFMQPTYYTDLKSTNSNMVIGVLLESWNDFNIENGDELAAFDTEGNLVGVSILEEANNVLVVWGDDLASEEKNGMLIGEEFRFEFWQNSSNSLFDVSFEWKEGVDYFTSNGINIASQIILEPKNENNLDYFGCFPNPSLGDFVIEFYLNNNDNISVTIFNSIGEKIFITDKKEFNKGLNSLPFHLYNLTQGLYYIELKGTDMTKTTILNITR